MKSRRGPGRGTPGAADLSGPLSFCGGGGCRRPTSSLQPLSDMALPPLGESGHRRLMLKSDPRFRGSLSLRLFLRVGVSSRADDDLFPPPLEGEGGGVVVFPGGRGAAPIVAAPAAGLGGGVKVGQVSAGGRGGQRSP